VFELNPGERGIHFHLDVFSTGDIKPVSICLGACRRQYEGNFLPLKTDPKLNVRSVHLQKQIESVAHRCWSCWAHFLPGWGPGLSRHMFLHSALEPALRTGRQHGWEPSTLLRFRAAWAYSTAICKRKHLTQKGILVPWIAWYNWRKSITSELSRVNPKPWRMLPARSFVGAMSEWGST
jgi:hypothetical protein